MRGIERVPCVPVRAEDWTQSGRCCRGGIYPIRATRGLDPRPRTPNSDGNQPCPLQVHPDDSCANTVLGITVSPFLEYYQMDCFRMPLPRGLGCGFRPRVPPRGSARRCRPGALPRGSTQEIWPRGCGYGPAQGSCLGFAGRYPGGGAVYLGKYLGRQVPRGRGAYCG